MASEFEFEGPDDLHGLAGGAAPGEAEAENAEAARQPPRSKRRVSEITPDQIKELREMTGAGVMDCKRALEAADGDVRRRRSTSPSRASPRPPRRRTG